MSQSDNPLAKASYKYQSNLATGFLARLFRALPRPVKRRSKFIYRLSLDGIDLLLGRRRELVPPRYLNFAGDGDFEATGDEFLRYFIELGGLKVDSRILEVGSGIGRMARPLTKYVTTGSFEGIDIVPEGIRWCSRHITSRYPNFHFRLADVQNPMYNPSGLLKPTEYRFPFNDREFDFVFLTSVFTHMLKTDMEHYLREVVRTMPAKGKCFVTFFLLNDEARRLSSAGLSSLDFRFSRDGCYIDDENVPEHAVAFDEEYIRVLYHTIGLDVEMLRYGSWCGRGSYLSYQDIVIASKS
jgi:ubiquinone/menaquinone biosynthesis C-methylase UbiE